MKLSQVTKVAEQDEEAVAIPIHERNGEPYYHADGKTVTTFDVLGSESPTYKRKRDAVLKKLVAAGASDEELAIGKLAAGVVGWSGPYNDDGSPLPFTPENLNAVLALEHVRNQVHAGIYRYAGFFTKAS